MFYQSEFDHDLRMLKESSPNGNFFCKASWNLVIDPETLDLNTETETLEWTTNFSENNTISSENEI